MKRQGFVLAVVLLAVVLVCGCGGSSGDLSGRVLFKGEPLQEGTVTVVGADNIPRQGAIEAGSYRIPKIPLGEAKILVVGPDSLPHPDWPKEVEAHTLRTEEGKAPKAPKAASSAKAPAGKRQPVRHIYAHLESTPLKATIKSGSNSHDIAVD